MPHIVTMQYTKNYPLGYLITMRAYGTWLHGDRRLSQTRNNNQYGTPKIEGNAYLERQMNLLLKHPVMCFDVKKRDIIKKAFEHVCQQFDWHLFALHVRTNHVHVVLQSDQHPDEVMRILKTKATTWLKNKGEVEKDKKVWSRHGSTIYLWTDELIYSACEYTVSEQGNKMAYIENL